MRELCVDIRPPRGPLSLADPYQQSHDLTKRADGGAVTILFLIALSFISLNCLLIPSGFNGLALTGCPSIPTQRKWSNRRIDIRLRSHGLATIEADFSSYCVVTGAVWRKLCPQRNSQVAKKQKWTASLDFLKNSNKFYIKH